MREGSFTGFEVSIHPPGIAEIRFNRPERLNAMTHSLKRDLIETLVQAQMDDAVRVILFSAVGRAFCAGDDLKGYLSADTDADALVPPLPAGHSTPIGTYDGLRTVSQQVNVAIRNLDKLSFEQSLDEIAAKTAISDHHPDAREGGAAFIEKREPQFNAWLEK